MAHSIFKKVSGYSKDLLILNEKPASGRMSSSCERLIIFNDCEPC